MGRLHMETMGFVFFHLCSQTCPGRELWAGQDVSSRKVLRGGSRGVLEPFIGRCPSVGGCKEGMLVFMCPAPGTVIELQARGFQLPWGD